MRKRSQNNQEAMRLFWLCWLAYTVVYIGRKNLSVCLPEMIQDGVTDKIMGGAIGTGFLICYAIGQLTGGVLGDRFSPRTMLSLGLFGCGCVNLLMGVNSVPWLFVLLWCCNGLFASLLWPTVIRCLSQGIPSDLRGKTGGWISSTIPAGSLLSYLVSALCLQLAGWRTVFLVCGTIVLLASFVEYFGVGALRDFQESVRQEKQQRLAPQLQKEPAKKSAFLLLLLSAGVPFMILGAVNNGALKDGFDFWIPTYITESFGIKASLTSLLTGIMPLVNLLGVYIAKGMDGKFFRNELATCGAMFGISAAAMVPLCLITASEKTQGSAVQLALSVSIIALVSTLMLGLNSQLLTFIPFYFGKIGKAATVTGILNASSYAAAALSDFLAGVLSKQYGWTVTLYAFLSTAVLGTVVCLAGARRWKNRRGRIA